MSCEIGFEILSSYVDGELSEGERRALDTHLEACEACYATMRGLKATKHAVSRISGRREPTEALLARVSAMRFESQPRTPARPRLFAAGIAALLCIVLLGLGTWWQSREEQPRWASMLVDDHLHSVPAAKPADVTSDDPEVVRQFFEKRLDFAPVVPEFPGARLIGGRLCILDGQHVELLFYERGGQALSLFVSGRDAFPQTCAESKGHNVCVRKKGSHEFMMVGALDAETLRATLKAL